MLKRKNKLAKICLIGKFAVVDNAIGADIPGIINVSGALAGNNHRNTGRVNAYKILFATVVLWPSTSLHGLQPILSEAYKRVVCKEVDIDATVPSGNIG